MRRLAILTAMILIMVTLGCASYYKVTDPATGKDYYTETVERNGGGCHIQGRQYPRNCHFAVLRGSGDLQGPI